MITLNDESLICIIGYRGSGKTEMARKILERIHPNDLCIVDPLDYYGDFGLPTVYNATQAADLFEKGTYSLRLVGADPVQAVDLMSLIYEISNCCLTLDEADSILGPYRYETPPAFYNLVNYGRHFKLSIVALAHRATDLPKILTGQSVVIHAPTSEPIDHKWLKQRLGQEPPRVGEYDFIASSIHGDVEVVNSRDL